MSKTLTINSGESPKFQLRWMKLNSSTADKGAAKASPKKKP